MPIDAQLLLWAIPLAFYGVSVAALYDAVTWSDAHWDAAGLPKLRWFLIMAFLGAIGAALYWFRARPKLEKINLRY
jgi:hypothetical protein